MMGNPYVVRDNVEIQELLTEAEDIEKEGENDGYVDGVLATLRWLTTEGVGSPDLLDVGSDDDPNP